MKIYQMRRQQQLPISLEEAWTLFSDPGKLPDITPSWMQFTVTSQPKGNIYPGMITTYHLRPLLGIRLTWVTEITQVQDQVYFVDEQRFGPYRFWHHEHHFKAIEGGVEIIDIVNYAMPVGVIGQAVHQVNVGRKLHDVFDYRYQTLKQKFGVMRHV
ncbi:SRPBCC family protein [Barrientosiimonas marina]|uniref:Cell division inhibitor n=1 Tax=Lentibacillus kimchii TaxID=1542911 RepID=A0ABW2UUC8_9BACI